MLLPLANANNLDSWAMHYNQYSIIVQCICINIMLNSNLLIFPGDPTVAGHLKPCQEILHAVEKSLKSYRYNGYGPSTGISSAHLSVQNVYLIILFIFNLSKRCICIFLYVRIYLFMNIWSYNPDLLEITQFWVPLLLFWCNVYYIK